MEKIHAVILAGGWGRRLWPKSRKSLPKQLLYLNNKHSLLQNLFNTIKSQIPRERIWVVSNQEQGKALRGQLPSLGRKNFLLEPLAKNTAAAVGLASVIIKRQDPQAVTVVLSCDQLYGQKKGLLQAMKAAAKLAAEREALIVIGIRPHRPAVEYGYLKITRSSKLEARSSKIFKVEKFIEKPALAKAKKYLKDERYLWNNGIFCWRVTNILEAIKKYLPGLHSGLQKIEQAWGRPGYQSRLLKEYAQFADISIDYGIMEKAPNIYTVVGDFSWQDLGSWDNLSQCLLSNRDNQGNIIQGLHKGIDTANSLILSEDKHLIATLGLRDLIIIHTPKATLICKKGQALEVKQLTQILEKDKRLRKYL